MGGGSFSTFYISPAVFNTLFYTVECKLMSRCKPIENICLDRITQALWGVSIMLHGLYSIALHTCTHTHAHTPGTTRKEKATRRRKKKKAILEETSIQ